ncbi:tyrosine-type recombinase/integrase [Oceanobacillus kimchii]|uniref:tyrosine-type recombinase/integrase n=1 Tax=Oceanobacillus kimchii TaxID=746691 RepID=UPI003C7620FA
MAGSIRKDGNTWYYILEIGNVNGKRKQKKKRGFKTKKDAQKALIEAEHTLLKDGMFYEPSNMLYEDFITQWLNDKKTTLKNSTLNTYKWLITNYIIPNLGNIELSKLSPIIVQQFYNSLINERIISRQNVQKIHSIINNSLDKALKWNLVNKNVAKLVDRPKAFKRELIVWNEEEVKIFLEVAIKSRYYIAYLLALSTGMRQGEILALKWANLELKNKSLSVTHTLSHDGKEILPGAKTRSSLRSIYLPDKTINALEEHRANINSEKQYADILYKDNDLIVCTNIGTPCNPRNLLRSFYSLIEKSKVPKIRFHDLRHTHATLLLKQGVNPKIVAERLGHSNIHITLDLYSHVIPSMQQESANKLNNIL